MFLFCFLSCFSGKDYRWGALMALPGFHSTRRRWHTELVAALTDYEEVIYTSIFHFFVALLVTSLSANRTNKARRMFVVPVAQHLPPNGTLCITAQQCTAERQDFTASSKSSIWTWRLQKCRQWLGFIYLICLLVFPHLHPRLRFDSTEETQRGDKKGQRNDMRRYV